MEGRYRQLIRTVFQAFKEGFGCLLCFWRQQQCSMSGFSFQARDFQYHFHLELSDSQTKKLWIKYVAVFSFCPERMFTCLSQLQMSQAATAVVTMPRGGCKAQPPQCVWICCVLVKICVPVVLQSYAGCCSGRTE